MKKKAIKQSRYFELRKPTYVTIQITPHKNIRGYTSNNIAKAIAHTYRAINKRIYREQKKLIIETNFKISYVIDIQDNNSSFYFLVPKIFLNLILEKIKEIWSKATVEIVEEGIKPFSSSSQMYSLSYKKEAAMSLLTDRKSNEPLNSILNVMEIMKEDDRITIVYNFMPSSQGSWREEYASTMKKITEKKSIEKKIFSFDYVIRNGAVALLGVLDALMSVVSDFLGNDEAGTQESLYTSILGVLERQDVLSSSTKKKKESTILNTQIAIITDSKDQTRKVNNAISVCQSYRVLDEDNELVYKKAKKVPLIEDYNFGVDTNTMSSEEVGSFIQVPGRMLLMQFGIKFIKTEESKVPLQLQTGTKNLGKVKYKGNTTKAYLEDEYNNGNLPLTLIGSQGGGKTTYIKHYVGDCIKVGEGVIVIDFIKGCELSEEIKKITPKNKLVEINLSNSKDIQGLGYNEIVITKDMDAFTKLNLASMQSKQVMSFIDSVSVGDCLTSRMRRFLNAAATVVFVQGFNSIKNVVDCLEDYSKREIYIKGLDIELKSQLEEEIRTLEELNEWSKATKEAPPMIVGTRESKIEHILDRVSMLREDFKLKYMYNKTLENNINLEECMREGKVVLFKMKESEFPTKMIKNIMVTYLISKVWLASQLRGSKEDKPLRCNIIVDEVFQAPTCMQNLEYILPQARKFGTKFVFSTQYIKQLDAVFDTLEASGSSFMLLTGSTEGDFNKFKNKFEGYEYDDLYNLEKFHSLNLIKYSEGYSSFISALPYKP